MDDSKPELPPKPEGPKINRKQRRRLTKAERQGRTFCRGCLEASRRFSDTGRITRGLHTHGRSVKGHDHATGVGFVPDKSTTRAVLVRMRDVKYWLAGETAPLLDDPRRTE